MILTCPNCDTRYSVDGSKFPAAGRTVRCAKCGHSWHQTADVAEPEVAAAPVEPVITQASDTVIATPTTAPAINPSSTASGTRAYAPQPAQPQERAPLGPKLAVVAGWAGLISVVLLIAWSAIRYR